jgi:hypothetical protein
MHQRWAQESTVQTPQATKPDARENAAIDGLLENSINVVW